MSGGEAWGMTYRTDRNNNPTAFTTDIAREAGLKVGDDYIAGDPFGKGFYTAKLLKDPISLTIQVIDRLTFYTKEGKGRWMYIAVPPAVWDSMTQHQKSLCIRFMYGREGGVELAKLWEGPTNPPAV